MAGIAYYILVRTLLAGHESTSELATAVDSDFKGKISVVLFAVGIPLAFVSRWLALASYMIVALLWLIPDRRIEKKLPK